MNDVLDDLLYKVCFVFIDDVIIYGETDEEVIANTHLVLQRIFEDGLKIGGKKCEFVVSSTNVLGHKVADGMIFP